MAAYGLAVGLHGEALEFVVLLHALGLELSLSEIAAYHCRALAVEERVDVDWFGHLYGLLRHLHALAVNIAVGIKRDTQPGALLDVAGIGGADGIDPQPHDRGLQLLDVLAYILVAHAALVHTVEVGIELQQNLLEPERLAAVWLVLRMVTGGILAQVLELLAAVELQKEVLLVVGQLEVAGVGQDDACVVETAAHVVDHQVVEGARLLVLVVDEEVVAGNLVVEYTLGNLEFGRFLLYGVEQGIHFGLGHRQHIVLEKEGSDGYEADEDYQGLHHLQQRDSGRLHGRELKALAEVAEGHERRQQDGERQSHRNHGQGRVEE